MFRYDLFLNVSSEGGVTLNFLGVGHVGAAGSNKYPPRKWNVTPPSLNTFKNKSYLNMAPEGGFNGGHYSLETFKNK